MSQVVEINDIEQLEGYRLLWNALLYKTRCASFFQSLDWLQTYWRHFGAAQRLRVLIVYSGGQPIGILPLTVRTESTRVGTVRVLTYPLEGWGSFYGPIGSDVTATLLAGLGHLRRSQRDWDLLDLRWVDRHGRDFGRTQRALEAVGFQPHRQPWTQVSLVDLAGSWEEYWQSRPRKWRRNVRWNERRLTEQGELRLVRHRPAGSACGDDDPRWDLYDQCEELARRSWQGSSQTGTTLSHAEVRPFLRDAHLAATRAGAADTSLLYLDDQPIAFSYHYHFDGRVSGLRMGHDPAERFNGAGTVHLYHLLRDTFERGDRLFDLGPGYLECKRYWQTSLVTSYRYSHFAPAAFRAQALRVKRWFDRRFDPERLPGLRSA